jgi:hypothetical protein
MGVMLPPADALPHCLWRMVAAMARVDALLSWFVSSRWIFCHRSFTSCAGSLELMYFSMQVR